MKHSGLSVSTACGLAIAIASLMFAGGAMASGPTETTLYTFLNGSDGANPPAAVVFDNAGNIYGTTQYGGEFGYGAVFELTPPETQGGVWSETTLYSFTGGSDGSLPSSGLIFDSKGALYGTTLYGGYNITGTVFKLTPPTLLGGAWAETTIYEFCKAGNPCVDGSRPSGNLVFDKKGNLYGTALGGGNAETGCCGLVFRLTPPHGNQRRWVETVLYTFLGNYFGESDGSGPMAGVIFDKSGNLYGTTEYGGDFATGGGGDGCCGVVFKLTQSGSVWTESLLYSFQGTDGAAPYAGLVFDSLGALYGTTSGGNQNYGNVFKLNPPAAQGGAWTEGVLHTFQFSDGGIPVAGVIFNSKGDLFGTTAYGGPAGGGNTCNVRQGCGGTVFQLTPPKSGTGAWKETILWDFANGAGGDNPTAGLTLKGGALYGTSYYGGGSGCQYGCGAVFELAP